MTALHGEAVEAADDTCEGALQPGTNEQDDDRFTDLMPLSCALNLLTAAGWSVRKGETGWTLGIGDVQIGRLPLSPDASLTLPVDGHGLLRAVERGTLDADLADSVSDTTPVDDVLVGFNWTMVRAGDLVGIARSPERGTQGARTVRDGEPIAGRPLNALAGWLCSLDPLRRSIGLAAINAFWNRPSSNPSQDKWGFARFAAPGDGLVVVGGFRGIAERLPKARIVEREPKGNDIPVDDAPEAFAQADAIAITAQTLMNGSLEPLLFHASTCPRLMLVGPSTPVAPLLLAFGLTDVCGLAVTDPEATARFIKETGTMIALDSQTQQIGLAR